MAHHRYRTLGKSKLGHRYMYRPPPAEHPLLRAALSAPSLARAAVELAPADWRPQGKAPRNQLQIGACTGFASAAFREILDAIKTGTQLPDYLSPAYLYGRTRMAEGSFPTDAGASIADEMATLVSYGTCPEAILPYTGDASEAPTPASDVAALPFRIMGPTPVDCTNPDAIKAALQSGPVAIAFTVYESFETPDANGVVSIPQPGEAMLGGHGVLIVGFNSRGWIVRNSWGTDWGDSGHAYMPIGYEANWFEAFSAAPQ